MRIALLHPTYWPEVRRGSERVVHDLGVALVARGHEVTVLTSHRARASRRVEDGLEIRRAWRPPRPPGLALHEYHLENVPTLILRLIAGSYELAHAFFPADAWAAVRARRLGGPPVVFSMHGIPLREYLVARRNRLSMLAEVVQEAAGCTVLSEAARTPFRDYLLRDPEVIGGGVDTSIFAPSVQRTARPTILCPASLGDPRKRAGLLFEALARLRRHRDVTLRVVRTPDPVMSMSDFELPEGAEWVDVDDSAALAAAYSSSWVTVLPSIYEAFGLVLIEALATGTPVVAARSGACPEVVDSDAIGRLFDPDSPEDLASALGSALELADDPETAVRCCARAADFDWSRLVLRHEAIYEGALSALPVRRAGTATSSDPGS